MLRAPERRTARFFLPFLFLTAVSRALIAFSIFDASCSLDDVEESEEAGAVEIAGATGEVETMGAVEIAGEVETAGAVEIVGEVETAGAAGVIETVGAVEMLREEAGAEDGVPSNSISCKISLEFRNILTYNA